MDRFANQPIYQHSGRRTRRPWRGHDRSTSGPHRGQRPVPNHGETKSPCHPAASNVKHAPDT